MIRMALDELERQLKEAALYYQMYGKGRDRLVRLQKQFWRYRQAVHEAPGGAEREEVSTPFRIAA